MKHLLHFLLTSVILLSVTHNINADTPIVLRNDIEKENDNDKGHRDWIEPPLCVFNSELRAIGVSFDYFDGVATISVTSLTTKQNWSVTASTMTQPIICVFDARPGKYLVNVATTTGSAYSGEFTIIK